MEGTEPPSFHSFACPVCQAGRRPSERTLNIQPVPSFVLNAEVHSCLLLQRWGSVVVVDGRTAAMQRAVVDLLHVPIFGTSMASNPFIKGTRRQRCEAFDALLQLLLSTDIDLDRFELLYIRMRDTRRDDAAACDPMKVRLDFQLLADIARGHGVVLDPLFTTFSLDGLSAWLAFHLRCLSRGHSLLLLCCTGEPNDDHSLWSNHGHSLAGALTWLASRNLAFVTEVRLPATCLC
jgi:hypothetical protein